MAIDSELLNENAALRQRIAELEQQLIQNDRARLPSANEFSALSQSLEALRLENERFRRFVDANITGIVIADANGKVITANDYYLKILGVTRQDFDQGKVDWLRATPPEWIAADEKALRELREFGICEPYEKEYLRTDGARVPVYIADAVLPGPDEYIAAYVLDITDLKQTEAALRQSEARYRSLFENMNEGFCYAQMLFDQHGEAQDFVYLAFNDKFKALRGLSDTAIGKRAGEVIPDLRASNPELFAIYARVASTGEPVRTDVFFEKQQDWYTFSVFSPQRGYFVVVFDLITDRKIAENALKTSEARYRRLFEAAKDGILILDADSGEIKDVNPFLVEMLGYSHAEFLGKQLWEIGLFKDIVANKDAFLKLQEEQYIRYQNLPLQTKAGQPIFVEFVSNVYDVNGRRVIQCNIRNVTDRQRVEQALSENRARLDAALASMTDAVFISDAQGNFIEFNQAFATFHKFKSKDECAITFAAYPDILDVFLEDGALAPSEQWAVPRALRGEAAVGAEYGLRRKDTGETWVGSYSFAPIRNTTGAIVGSVVVARDITERKLAQDELRTSKLLLQNVIDNTSALVYIFDLEGRCLLANRKLELLFGLPSAQMMGQTRQVFVSAEAAAQHRQHDLEIIRTGQGNLFEEENPESDGRHVYLTTKFPLFDARNKVYAVCGISTDMTERIHMEEELRRSNAELEQFAYVASHDLQEPLRAVAGMVQLLSQRYKGQLDERGDEYIGHAVEASARMQNLINDLLNYSRVSRLGKPFEAIAVDSSLQTALANLQVSIQESQAAITQDALPTVLADQRQLTQVLQNLIGNALKFRGDSPPQIHIGAQKVGRLWRIAVSDNGIGIEPQYYERIFLVFQRLHTRRQYPGTGIGLSLCKKIIERHGGQIWVESQPGQGATFYFTIPEV